MPRLNQIIAVQAGKKAQAKESLTQAYHLLKKPKGDVTLTVLDAKGTTVQVLTSKKEPPEKEEAGDYEGARLLHFFAMSAVGLIVVVHIVMVILVPRTFPSMLTGKIRRSA